MAEEDSNKTEQPTAKRKGDARKKGQLAISREVPNAVILLGGVGLLALSAGPAIVSLTRLMREWLQAAPVMQVTTDNLHALMLELGADGLILILPIVGGIAVLGAASYLAQTGFLWRTEGMALDLTRLSPGAGWKRIVSLRSGVEVLKALVKVVIIGSVAVLAVRQEMQMLPDLVTYDLEALLPVIGGIGLKMALWIGLAIGVLAGLDYLYQRYEWERGLRMTRTEVKMEHRESEGDPQVKARIRTLQRDMARNRMMAAVPKADVVITNPTHLAVALQYDQKAMEAPVVIAKGAGYIAERIKEIARDHGIAVVEDKFIARTLYKLVDVGREIPVDLYRAVAEILALVYRAKGRVPTGIR
jgi:flagellar biosynthetic protein FlhB